MRDRKSIAATATLLLAVAVAESVGVAQVDAQPTDFRAPAVDHHQHLLSPAAAELWSDRPLPVVLLPPELEALLAALERSWNDAAGLAPHYAEDSVLFEPRSDAFVRGREASRR